MADEVLGKILVVCLDRAGNDHELRSDLADDNPIDQHKVAKSSEHKHGNHVQKGSRERDRVSQIGLEREGRKDWKSQDEDQPGQSDYRRQFFLLFGLGRHFFLDDVRIVSVAPHARAERDHEEQKISGQDPAIDETLGDDMIHDHVFILPTFVTMLFAEKAPCGLQ